MIHMETNPLKDSTKLPDEFTALKLSDYPHWLANEVKRQTAGTDISHEAFMVISIQQGFNRLNTEPLTDFWRNLYDAAISRDQLWPEPDEYDEFCQMCVLKWPIPDPDNLGKQPRALRIPKALSSQVGALAGKLGMSVSHLAQHLILDGLRAQEGTNRPDLLDRTFDAFYTKLRKRLFRVARQIQSLRDGSYLVLSAAVHNALVDLGVEGGSYEP